MDNIRYRPAGTPFRVFTFMEAIGQWILTEASHPVGEYRLYSFGDIIILIDLKHEKPNAALIDEALAKILKGDTG